MSKSVQDTGRLSRYFFAYKTLFRLNVQAFEVSGDIMNFAGKNIVMIVTGSIAACKSPALLRFLQSCGAVVDVVMTQNAVKLISPTLFSALSARVTYVDGFHVFGEGIMPHIRLAQEADCIVVSPATANFIAKMAHGIADDLAASLIIAARSPIVIAPAMNPLMWQYPACQRNIATLKADDMHVVEPVYGMTACGEEGLGKMAENEAIAKVIYDIIAEKQKRPQQEFLQNNIACCDEKESLKGKSVLITSGSTMEFLDPVRFLSNRSSGKQGVAIAQAFVKAGARVIFVAGKMDVAAPENCEVHCVKTAQDMLKAVKKLLPVDIVVCVAAVCDWQAVAPSEQKIPKNSAEIDCILKLHPTPDVLAYICNSNRKTRPDMVIGFSAVTGDAIEKSKDKLIQKSCDVIVSNEIQSDGFPMGADTNQVAWIERDNIDMWPRMKKSEVAARLVEKVATWIESKEGK